MIEANQRNIVKLRQSNNHVWENQFFEFIDNEWRFQFEKSANVKDAIFGPPRKPIFEKFWIVDDASDDDFQDAKE